MSGTTIHRVGRPRDPQKDSAAISATAELLAQHGFYGLRVADISELSQLPKSTIYRRWPSILALVVDTYRAHLPQIEVDHEIDPRDAIQSIVDQLHTMYRKHPLGQSLPVAGATILFDSKLSRSFRSSFITPIIEALTELVEKATEAGTAHPALSAQRTAELIWNVCIFGGLANGVEISAEETSQMVRSLLGVED